MLTELVQLELHAATVSVSLRPLVSNGKSITQIPERAITTSKKINAGTRWQPVTNWTATRGHIIPPILPTALATP